MSRQPSDIRALLAGPSVDSSLTSLALPDRPQVVTYLMCVLLLVLHDGAPAVGLGAELCG